MGTPACTGKHNWLQHRPGGQPRAGRALCEDTSTPLQHSFSRSPAVLHHNGGAHSHRHRHSLQCSLLLNRTVWFFLSAGATQGPSGQTQPMFPTCGWRGLWHRNGAPLPLRRVWVTAQFRDICYSIDLFKQIMKSLSCLSFPTSKIYVYTWKKHSVKSKQHFRDENL